jgi:hypothetical protein
MPGDDPHQPHEQTQPGQGGRSAQAGPQPDPEARDRYQDIRSRSAKAQLPQQPQQSGHHAKAKVEGQAPTSCPR